MAAKIISALLISIVAELQAVEVAKANFIPENPPTGIRTETCSSVQHLSC